LITLFVWHLLGFALLQHFELFEVLFWRLNHAGALLFLISEVEEINISLHVPFTEQAHGNGLTIHLVTQSKPFVSSHVEASLSFAASHDRSLVFLLFLSALEDAFLYLCLGLLHECILFLFFAGLLVLFDPCMRVNYRCKFHFFFLYIYKLFLLSNN
jgi:hypothetical protein